MDETQPIFNPKEPPVDKRRREWVSLDQGRLCLWEMEFADTMFVLEQSHRMGPDAKVSPGESLLWQIMACAYNGVTPDATRIFDITDLPRLQKLRQEETARLTAALARVNGMEPEAIPKLQDFTAAVPVELPRS